MKLRVEVTSDTICPWCFVGKRNLEQAIARLPEHEVEVAWLPYQLDPAMPRAGMDYPEYMRRKFGQERGFRGLRERIDQLGEAASVRIDWARIRRRPNTLDSHRLVHWTSPGEQQNALVDRLFVAFFQEGRDVGERDVLCSAAADVGMDAEQVAVWLEEGRDAQEVLAACRAARQGGVTGVPNMRVGDRIDIPGAQDPSTLERLIRRVAEVLASEMA